MFAICLLKITFEVVAGIELVDGQPTRWRGLLGRQVLTETALHVPRSQSCIVEMLGSVTIR